MKTILLSLMSYIGSNLSKVICSICDAVKSFFQYKRSSVQNKIDIRKKKEKEEYEKEVDKVTEDGTIEDLLNLRR